MTTLSRANAVPLPLAIRRFGLHFLEMCVVMCIGGASLGVAIVGAATLLGYPNFVSQAPPVAIVLVAVELAAVMVVYMAVRGHPLRHNVEMSGSTVLGALPFLGAFWLGLIPDATFAAWSRLFSLMCTSLCVLMFFVMLVRFDHYGGRVGASAAAATAAASGEYTCSMHPEVRQAGPGRCPICDMKLVRRR